jgi:hypothetical protein
VAGTARKVGAAEAGEPQLEADTPARQPGTVMRRGVKTSKGSKQAQRAAEAAAAS